MAIPMVMPVNHRLHLPDADKLDLSCLIRTWRLTAGGAVQDVRNAGAEYLQHLLRQSRAVEGVGQAKAVVFFILVAADRPDPEQDSRRAKEVAAVNECEKSKTWRGLLLTLLFASVICHADMSILIVLVTAQFL